MDEPVPFVDLLAMHAEVAEEVSAGMAAVIASGAFIGGPDVGLFEQEFARFSGRSHCVGTGNGTDAIELALRAAGVGRGDEVVLPANTFVASAEAVVRAGAVPVLVDVDPDTLLMDPAAVEAVIGPRTAALLPVHLYGQLAPMEQLHEVAGRHGLITVEDAAQAQGATRHGQGVGAGSAAAATSFYPGKNLGAYGDAGAVVTDDGELADRVRLLGDHGSRRKYVHEVIGTNSRLDTLQAVVLRAKLKCLAAWNGRRREAADRYAELLGELPMRLPVVAQGNVHVWHLYVVRVDPALRSELMDGLTRGGIGAGIHYPVPVHLHEAFEHLGHPTGDFPVAEEAAAASLSLPMHPALTAAQQHRVAAVLAATMARVGTGVR